ncbi:hypothetical protein [Mycolicibacterium fortuitum]|uniref:hypothetical protein n=1 Tax=Mycolicibacterium fortuitum TaxID=1766 RepID=UPI00260725EA|nr:hypothetical protein [Mycolicibacterium fortuitum]
MSATRLRLDSAAQAVSANAAARAEMDVVRTRAHAIAELAAVKEATPNGFNQAATALTAAARELDRSLCALVAARGVAVAAVSASGFAALDAMNEDNAVALSTLGE